MDSLLELQKARIEALERELKKATDLLKEMFTEMERIKQELNE